MLFTLSACSGGSDGSSSQIEEPKETTQETVDPKDGAQSDNDSAEETETVADITAPFSSDDIPVHKREEVVKMLQDAGFINIIEKGTEDVTARQADLFLDHVWKVEINGSKFSEGQVFDADAEIVVTYGSFSEKEYIKAWGPPALAVEDGVDAYISALQTPGSVVYFGHYEHDLNPDNVHEPIKWLVLDTDGSKSLLLSYMILDVHEYNARDNAGPGKTWENCTFRAWLNSDFLNTAFTPEEQTKIVTTTIDNSRITKIFEEGDVAIGNPTNDKVFILDLEETQKYIDEDVKNGIGACGTLYSRSKNPYEEWWARSPLLERNVSFLITRPQVQHQSYIDQRFSTHEAGVKPAIWVDINAFSN